MVKAISTANSNTYPRANANFGHGPQEQQYTYRRENKATSYAKTAARGFLLGAGIDAAFQVIMPRMTNAFSKTKEAIPKFNVGKTAAWGATFAIIDLAFRAFSGREY